jgi:hypothetical protein
MTIQDTANQAGAVAKASTQAAFKASMIGIVPILEFGVLIALTIMIVAVPIKIVNRLVK